MATLTKSLEELNNAKCIPSNAKTVKEKDKVIIELTGVSKEYAIMKILSKYINGVYKVNNIAIEYVGYDPRYYLVDDGNNLYKNYLVIYVGSDTQELKRIILFPVESPVVFETLFTCFEMCLFECVDSTSFCYDVEYVRVDSKEANMFDYYEEVNI